MYVEIHNYSCISGCSRLCLFSELLECPASDSTRTPSYHFRISGVIRLVLYTPFSPFHLARIVDSLSKMGFPPDDILGLIYLHVTYEEHIRSIPIDKLHLLRQSRDYVTQNLFRYPVEWIPTLLQDKKVDPSYNDNWAIRWASEVGHTDIVALLLKDERVDPSGDKNEPILLASQFGHTNVVALLLKDKRVDPSPLDNYALRFASENGHADVVTLLLKDERVDPSADDNYAIGMASENGHIDILALLLTDERVDPSGDDNYAIRLASENGHIDVVALLLKDKRVDPSARDDYAIRYASQSGHTDVVALLQLTHSLPAAAHVSASSSAQSLPSNITHLPFQNRPQ